MKKLILFLTALQLACSASAATYYKVTLTVTSVPPVKAALSGDGDLRQVTNSTPANAGKFWQSTNTLQATATNLVEHLRSYGFTNQLAVKLGTNDTATPTNTVVIELSPDRFVSFTSLSNWVSITYSTNTTASGWIGVRVPVSNEVATVQTQVVSGLVAALNMNTATNTVSNAAPAMANFISTKTNAQAVTNLSTSGGTHSGGTLSNSLAQRLKLGYGGTTISNNGIWFLSNPTNAQGVVVIAPGAGGFPSMYWITNSGAADFSASYEGEYLLNMLTAAKMFPSLTELYAGKTNLFAVVNWFTNNQNRWINGSVSNASLLAGGIYGDWTVGTSEIIFTNSQLLFGSDSIFGDVDSGRVFTLADAGTGGRSTNAFLSYADFNRSQFTLGVTDFGSLGLASGLATTNQGLYGATTHSGTNTGGRFRNVNIEAVTATVTSLVAHALSATNVTLDTVTGTNVSLWATRLRGVNTNEGALMLSAGTISTLAAGNNIVTRPTNNLVRFTATAGATINAITNGFGDGDWFMAWNETGAGLGIAHESGFSGVASTRLLTHNGADFTAPVNALLLFSQEAGSVNRWRVAQLYPALSTSTNTTILTNGVSAGDGVLNFVGSAVTVTNADGTNFIVITASGTGGTNFVALTNGTAFNLAATALANTDVALTVTNATGRTNDVLRVLSTNQTAGVWVKADGKVGINTNAPGRELDVNGGIAFRGVVRGQSGSEIILTQNGAAPGGNRGVLIFDSGTPTVSVAGRIGFATTGTDAGGSDTMIYRPGSGTNGFGTTASTPAGSILASNLALRGQIEITQTTTTNVPSTDSVRLWAANNGGTAELIASDEAGNVVQLTSHPADAPEAFYITTNWTRALPRISKTVNRYIGVIEWNNDTLGVLLRRWELRGTNIAGLPQGVRNAIANALHEEETFAEYNARMGYTNGHPEALVRANWVSLQAQRQAGYDAARAQELEEFNTPLTVTNDAGAAIVLPNNTNVTVRAARDIRKPQPHWLKDRVDNSKRWGN